MSSSPLDCWLSRYRCSPNRKSRRATRANPSEPLRLEKLEARETPAIFVPSDISGRVFVDCNNNGVFDAGEEPIPGVTINLTGTDIFNKPIAATVVTAADGTYKFAKLDPGTYNIVETQPAGFFDGKDQLGFIVGAPAANNGVAGNDTFTNIILDGGDSHGFDYNFGELLHNSLSGTVYFDINDNGVQNAGEPGIAGAKLVLAGTNDLATPINQTVFSAADGTYSFTDLRPGDYSITETTPAGFVDGQDTVGQTDGVTNGQLSPPDSIVNISLDGCHSGVGYNFGETKLPPALNSISGFVYQDCNDNGVFDAGDEPIANVTVNLTGIDSSGATVSLTATTDATGLYQFSNLKAGVYTLTEQQPSGFLDNKESAGTPFGGIAAPLVGQDTISAINIPVSTTPQNGVNYNFGEVGTSIAGIIYEDTNDNGVRDPSELLITVPVTVTLTGADDLGNAVNRTLVTTTGKYQFDLLRPGTYSITETQPAGYIDGKDSVGQTNGVTNGQLSPPDSIVNISLDGCHAGTSYNFGETKQQPAVNTISGFVYEDCNANGTFDPGSEEGIASVVVMLAGVDSTGASVNLSTTTDANGFYQFTNLKAGTYTLTEQQPAGFLDNQESVGTPFGGVAGSTIGQDVISAINIPLSTTPQNGVNYNFGEVGASIAGVIYEDENNNGVRDAGEDLITESVTITLTGTDDTGAAVNRSVTTTTGQYQFDQLRPGSYSLTETQPAGFTDGIDTPGTPFGGTAQEPDTIVNISVDGCHAGMGYNFGEQCPPSSLSGFVYFDTGAGTGSPGFNNGIREDSEVQISGVTITLTGVDNLGNPVSLTTTTGQLPGKGAGFYQFSNLREGTYTIAETQPSAGGQLLPDGKDTPGTPTGSVVLVNDTISNIVLPCAFNGVNNNFGELGNQSAPGNATLSGMVYIDWNCNGLKDANDTTGIAGVTITLVNSDTNAVLAQTTTDKNGHYSFTDLSTGNYTLIETQPPNFMDSGENVGTPFGGNTSVNDQIRDIQIPQIPDDTTLNGVNYDFGECNNPTKRNFFASFTP